VWPITTVVMQVIIQFSTPTKNHSDWRTCKSVV